MKPAAVLLCAMMLALGGLNAYAQAPSAADSQPSGKGSVADGTHRGGSPGNTAVGANKSDPNQRGNEELAGSKGVVTTGGTGVNEDQGNNH